MFTDDVQGLGEEHPQAQVAMNLSAPEVADIRNATQAAWQKMFDKLHAAGKYNWQVRAGKGRPRAAVATGAPST